MFARSQALHEKAEIGVRQRHMGTAKRGHDLDSDSAKGGVMKDGNLVEALQKDLANHVDLLVVSRQVRREAVAAPARIATLEPQSIRAQ